MLSKKSSHKMDIAFFEDRWSSGAYNTFGRSFLLNNILAPIKHAHKSEEYFHIIFYKCLDKNYHAASATSFWHNMSLGSNLKVEDYNDREFVEAFSFFALRCQTRFNSFYNSFYADMNFITSVGTVITFPFLIFVVTL